jgi:hypothetical protein
MLLVSMMGQEAEHYASYLRQAGLPAAGRPL